jgi:putative copper resistance protein D
VSETVIVQWLHITSAVVWLGGKIFTSFVLNPVLRLGISKEIRLELLKILGKRFRYISWGSLVVLIITGVINTSQRVSGIEGWLGSKFGALLIIKLFLVATMIGISTAHTLFLTPWIRKKSLENDDEGFKMARKTLILVSRVNIFLGISVLLLAVLLKG